MVEEIEKKVLERNRLVRIGDQYGWDTVQEYVGSDLACDESDANKLRQAEFREPLRKGTTRWGKTI